MKDWEVRAIREGRKTQSRQIVKPQPTLFTPSPSTGCGPFYQQKGREFFMDGASAAMNCPYGQPGDRLWVRETWSSDFAKHYPHDCVWYAADDDRKKDITVRNGVRGIFSPENQEHVPFRWRPSIHMPRWASRITLEIVSVRAERLQDISEADALAEGITHITMNAPRIEYRWLWGNIKGSNSWDANPWVWVPEFKVVK